MLARLVLGLAVGPAWAQDGAQNGPAAVGRITYAEVTAPGAAICSGVLVAPDMVLTAAHCVRSAAATPEILRFDAGWTMAEPARRRRGQAVILASAAPVAGLAGLREDVALIILDIPFSSAEVTPLPIAAPVGEDFTLYAFGRNAPDQPAPPLACTARAMPPGLLGLDCPVVSGNSGAPVLQRYGADGGANWQIVAIMIAASRAGPVRSWAAQPPALLQQQIKAMQAPP